jgi:hypothetical protein
MARFKHQANVNRLSQNPRGNGWTGKPLTIQERRAFQAVDWPWSGLSEFGSRGLVLTVNVELAAGLKLIGNAEPACLKISPVRRGHWWNVGKLIEHFIYMGRAIGFRSRWRTRVANRFKSATSIWI